MIDVEQELAEYGAQWRASQPPLRVDATAVPRRVRRERVVLVGAAVVVVIAVSGALFAVTRSSGSTPSIESPAGTSPSTSPTTSTTLGRSIPTVSTASAEDCFSREVIDGYGPDGLPPLDTVKAAPDLSQMTELADTLEGRIQGTFPGVVDVSPGPGFGRAWTRDEQGTVQVVPVNDYWLIVTVSDASQCPTIPGGVGSIGGASLFFRHLA